MRNLLIALSLVVSAPAWALKQSEHSKIAFAACINAGLLDEFCERVGDETYNVDGNEWNDLSAHAQIEVGQTACTAANAARERLRKLGSAIRRELWLINSSSTAASSVAVSLGRVLHTIEDNCAHRGMPNPQHAWWSLSDQCRDTSLSPDVDPAGIVCARVESDRVFAMLHSAMEQTGAISDAFSAVSSGATHWPSRGDICHFMKTLSQEWDGVDRRWENAIVTPALRAQLERALTTEDDSSTGDICGGDEQAIRARWPNHDVDTSRGQGTCISLSSYCLGKADATDVPPPWEDPAATTPHGAGCTVAGGDVGSAAPPSLLLLALAIIFRKEPATRARRVARPRPPR